MPTFTAGTGPRLHAQVRAWLALGAACVTFGCGTHESLTPSAPATPTPVQPAAPANPVRGLVSITFDDGYESAYRYGIPVFDRLGLRSTEYIITRSVGASGYVSWDDVATLQARGDEIGSHTRTHPHLSTLSRSGDDGEVRGALTDLAAHGINATTFAYPYGDFNDTVVAVNQSAGYRAARTTMAGFNSVTTPPLMLRGMLVEDDHATTAADIEHWVDEAISANQWLILVIHRVDEDGNPISIDHQVLEAAADYIARSGVRVVTLADGLQITGIH